MTTIDFVAEMGDKTTQEYIFAKSQVIHALTAHSRYFPQSLTIDDINFIKSDSEITFSAPNSSNFTGQGSYVTISTDAAAEEPQWSNSDFVELSEKVAAALANELKEGIQRSLAAGDNTFANNTVFIDVDWFSTHHLEIITDLSVMTLIPFVPEMDDHDSDAYKTATKVINGALNTARYFAISILSVGSPTVDFVRGVTDLSLRPSLGRAVSGNNTVAVFRTSVIKNEIKGDRDFRQLEKLVGEDLADELEVKVKFSIQIGDQVFEASADPLVAIETACIVDGIIKTTTTTTTTTTTPTTTTPAPILNDGAISMDSHDWRAAPEIIGVCDVTIQDILPNLNVQLNDWDVFRTIYLPTNSGSANFDFNYFAPDVQTSACTGVRTQQALVGKSFQRNSLQRNILVPRNIGFLCEEVNEDSSCNKLAVSYCCEAISELPTTPTPAATTTPTPAATTTPTPAATTISTSAAAFPEVQPFDNSITSVEQSLKTAEKSAISSIENMVANAKTFQKIKRNIILFSRRLKKVTRGENIICDRVRNPAKARKFKNNVASEIMAPFQAILKKYSNCARFGDYQNRLIRLQDSLKKVL